MWLLDARIHVAGIWLRFGATFVVTLMMMFVITLMGSRGLISSARTMAFQVLTAMLFIIALTQWVIEFRWQLTAVSTLLTLALSLIWIWGALRSKR